MNINPVLRHLRECDEHYWEHLAFTVKASATLLAAGVVVIIHGLLPCFFTHTGSRLLGGLTDEMKARKDACEARRRATAGPHAEVEGERKPS